jgi:hypothetical protein
MHPVAGTVLLSLDEKTGIQAKSRKHRTRPARRGHPARREFEYVRHGTVSLLAAMNVADPGLAGRPPPVQVTHTPVHASWLNMVEIYFSIITRRLLRRAEFDSREHLARKILAFVDFYNKTAKPFRWSYGGRPLAAA